MPRPTKKSMLLEKAKKDAPNIPGNTCPYIDFVLDTLSRMDKEDTPLRTYQGIMLKETLEYIRKSNETLRESSKYWYDCYKRDIGKIE